MKLTLENQTMKPGEILTATLSEAGYLSFGFDDLRQPVNLVSITIDGKTVTILADDLRKAAAVFCK